MHRKHIFLGFLLGLAVGAYYHYANKDTRKDQDSLYQLVSRVRGKVEEAKDPNSDLHAKVQQVTDKAKDAADDAASKVKDAADQAGSKVKSATSKAQAKVEIKSDDAASKVQQVADSAAKHVDERAGGE